MRQNRKEAPGRRTSSCIHFHLPMFRRIQIYIKTRGIKMIGNFKLFLPLLLLLHSAGESTGTSRINFESNLSWDQVLAKARQEKKFIFVDCVATWCAPCKEMERRVFTVASVADTFNKYFVSVRLQIDSSADDSNETKRWYAVAHKMSLRYKIESVPTYLFFSPEGNIVHEDLGFMSADEFVNAGI